VLVELTPFAAARFTHDSQLKFASALYRDRDIAEYLRGQPGLGRVVVNDQDIPANFGEWHAIEMLQGYVAGAPANLVEGYMHTDRFRQLANVTHYVGKQPGRPNQTEVFTGASSVKVFRVPDPMPRAWAVHEAVSVKTRDEAAVKFQDPAVDLRRTVALVGGAPALQACEGDQVRVVRHAANRVTIQAQMVCRGMVMLGDSYYPGWRAKVDGRPAEIHAAYGVVRGVVVEAGTHEIDMRYLPTSFVGGGLLTLLGLLAVVFSAKHWRRTHVND